MSDWQEIMPFGEIIKGPMATPILQVINKLNYIQPSKIQNQVIPILSQKKDLILQARSGSGKTTAFLISILLHVDPEKYYPQIILICDTYEVTMQTYNIFQGFNKYTKFTSAICLNDNEHNTPPSKDAQILFGMPNSFVHWITQKALDVSNVNFLVIANANLILSNGSPIYSFTNSLMNKFLPANVQYGFFSELYNNYIIDFIKKKRPDITVIRQKNEESSLQHYYTLVSNQEEGFATISNLVNFSKGQIIVFVRSKKLTNEISQFLLDKGVTCKTFTKDLSSQERFVLFDEFLHEQFKAFVVCETLPVGIKIPNTFIVVNYQMPIKFIDAPNKKGNATRSVTDDVAYFQMAQRAGRFGRTGIYFTIVTDERDEKSLIKCCSSLTLNKIGIDKINELPNEQPL